MRAAFLMMALAAAAIAIGCGDDDSGAAGQPVTTSSLSKAKFINQANQICAKGGANALAELGAYEEENRSDGAEGDAFAGAAEAALLPVVQDVTDEIRELGAPQGDEEQVEAFLESMQEAIDSGNEGGITSLEDFSALFEAPGKLAREYGLTGCFYGEEV